MSAMLPHICTGITHFVLLVIAARTAAGDKVKLSSISTNTGIAPILKMASKLATKVNAGIITSSPAPTPSAAIAVVKAAVPLDVNCAYCEPKVAQTAASNSLDFQIPFLGPSNP